MEQKNSAFAMGVLFEAGLGLLGVGFAWLVGISLQERLQPSQASVVRGLLAALPMFVMLAYIMLSRWPCMAEIRQHVETLTRALFAEANIAEVALMSLAAGVGEELLFRGALQPWIASWTTPWIALAVVSLMFGLAHAVSDAYFYIATAIGAYWGWLAMAYDDLVAPLVAHAVYDFIAILVVR